MYQITLYIKCFRCEINFLLSISFTQYPCHQAQENLKVLLHYNCLIIIHNIVTIIFKVLKILCNLILANQLNCHIWYYKKYQFQIFKPLWLSYARLQPCQVYCTTGAVFQLVFYSYLCQLANNIAGFEATCFITTVIS